MLTRDKLHALLDEAAAAGLHAQLSIHDAPAALVFEWLDRELVSAIEKGAGTNPPTVHETGATDDHGFSPNATIFLKRELFDWPASAVDAAASS